MAWTSLAVSTADATLVSAGATNEHFDPGWIRTSKDPANPKARFDYSAEGGRTPAPRRQLAAGSTSPSR